jgi:thiamine biosynthesis lipoprotein
MGSEAHVIVTGDPDLLRFARARIEQLERRWSRFVPDSEVSLLNDHRGVPRKVSNDTLRLIGRAVEGWRETGGRFDPTVLGDLIREGYDRPFQAVLQNPGSGISALRRNAGGVRFDPETSTVELPPDAGFDPGGVGKGLGADMVVEELLAAGADGACVNLGGDLRVEGDGPDEGRWVIALDHPTRPAPIGLVALTAGGIATSTSVRRAWIIGRERRNHLIDPGTGRSLRSEAVAVTVLSRDAASAEIATKHALLAEAGFELNALEDLGCDGLVVTEDGETRWNAGFARFLVEPARGGDGK